MKSLMGTKQQSCVARQTLALSSQQRRGQFPSPLRALVTALVEEVGAWTGALRVSGHGRLPASLIPEPHRGGVGPARAEALPEAPSGQRAGPRRKRSSRAPSHGRLPGRGCETSLGRKNQAPPAGWH